MKKLDNESNNVPGAEPRGSLSSNDDVMRGSALGFGNAEPPVEILLDQLAEILVEAYFYEKRNSK
jgi:hypothetical protein